MNYNHNLVEKKWLKYWKNNKTYDFVFQPNKPKFYVLDMFPYPSGKGLHVGHIKGYTATDVISRYKKSCGFNVIHPIGYDAFGLPAEQFAILTNEHPSTFTQKNIENFRKQLERMGFDYNPNLEINTTDPNYYHWTQWIFNQLYKKGLAKLDNIEVNWCEKLGTVLADEEVITDENGNKVSERGFYPVIKKIMRQWVLKITQYADSLLDGLNEINWPNSIKKMQQDWIGKNDGIIIDFNVHNSSDKISIFTTRSDTIFGVTFIVISPEHPLINKIVTKHQKHFVDEYIQQYKNNSIATNHEQQKIKTGVFTGSYAIHPITKKLIPIWIGDYVLKNYGTGAIMAVPAHDAQDNKFASKYNLKINCVVLPTIGINSNFNNCYEGDGVHINSSFINGLYNEEAIKKINEYIVKNKIGKIVTVYRLRDWIFSRQRYWGEPFPILFDESNQVYLIEDLPVILPEMKTFTPNKDGLPPLANANKWTNVIIDNKLYKRELNTMPQWAGSCWYYLAYLMKIGMNKSEYLPINSEKAKKMFDHFLPVDIYVGGQEHAVLHLLYARFWHRFLYDIGIVSTPEPFMRLINQGMILNSDGTKMSKSKGTLINPDDICESHGADTLRLYEMFMGPITASLIWNSNNLDGMRKWIERVWNLFHKIEIYEVDEAKDENLKIAYHSFVNKSINFLEKFEFNLMISEMMIFVNQCYKILKIPKKYLEGFLTFLSFICPFISEELNEFIGNKNSVTTLLIPKANPNLLISNKVIISCMINGKFRGSNEFDINVTQNEVVIFFSKYEKTKIYLENKKIKKIIFIPNKIVSFII